MTDTIWYIIHAIVAAVAFAVGFRISAKIREWRDNTRNIEREIPFSLFLEAYGKAQDRWTLLPYYVRYGADDVRFENYADYRKYKKWREKRKRDAEEERKRSMNERLFRDIRNDIMPTPPTTGTNVIKPNPNFAPPPTVYKPSNPETMREEIKKYAESRQWGRDPLDGVYAAMKSGWCGNCVSYEPATQAVGYCASRRQNTHATFSCPLHVSYKAETKAGVCGKCRQFDKGDNSPFGYCFRNDEIVNEASVKGCFEPKSKAEERQEPLGTVTTH